MFHKYIQISSINKYYCICKLTYMYTEDRWCHLEIFFIWRPPLNYLATALLCIGFNFQHMPSHSRTVPACNRGFDNHNIVMYHWNITPQAHSYDISPGHIILATGQPVFLLHYPLYVECLTRELQLLWNFWLDSTGNQTPTSQTLSERPNHSATELAI